MTMNKGNMIVKVYINVAMIYFVILIRHLHSFEKMNDNRQRINCTNALIYIPGSAVESFNMKAEPNNNNSLQTQFSTKLNQILKNTETKLNEWNGVTVVSFLVHILRDN